MVCLSFLFNAFSFFSLEKYVLCLDKYLADAEYADLVTNPERFTGYKGAHAHKIWNSIYRENCFEEWDFNLKELTRF